MWLGRVRFLEEYCCLLQSEPDDFTGLRQEGEASDNKRQPNKVVRSELKIGLSPPRKTPPLHLLFRRHAQSVPAVRGKCELGVLRSTIFNAVFRVELNQKGIAEP
jgi:hypothetical protein